MVSPRSCEARRGTSIDLTPVLGIWGENDPLVLPINANLLLQKLQKSRAIYLDAGHFVWEQQPEAYAAAVLDWVKGGYTAS
jgi:pimeloyl-ACP methyl ester carboxylesterase